MCSPLSLFIWCLCVVIIIPGNYLSNKLQRRSSDFEVILIVSSSFQPIVLKLELKKGNVREVVLESVILEEHDETARKLSEEREIVRNIENVDNELRDEARKSKHEPLRARTSSNPSMMNKPPVGSFHKRRINSLLPHQPIVHSPEWLKKAHAILYGQDSDDEDDPVSSTTAGSIKPKIPKRKLSRVSSRLTSHHSSSSEEWYSELPDVPESNDPFSQSGAIGNVVPEPISNTGHSTETSSKPGTDSSNNRRPSKAENTSCLKCTIM